MLAMTWLRESLKWHPVRFVANSSYSHRAVQADTFALESGMRRPKHAKESSYRGSHYSGLTTRSTRAPRRAPLAVMPPRMDRDVCRPRHRETPTANYPFDRHIGHAGDTTTRVRAQLDGTPAAWRGS